MKKRMNRDSGFTLVEVVISMAIAGMMTAGIYGVYTIQQRSYTGQEQVSEMQQQGRAALDLMTRDIRMAGYLGTCTGSANILRAQPEDFKFQYCVEEDGSVRDFTYNKRQNGGPGNADGGALTPDLHRTKGGGNNEIAEGADGLELLYIDKNGIASTAPADLSAIRTVRVSLLIRSANPDPRYTDTTLYESASVQEGVSTSWDLSTAGITNPPNDHYHRRLLITSVQLRNM